MITILKKFIKEQASKMNMTNQNPVSIKYTVGISKKEKKKKKKK